MSNDYDVGDALAGRPVTRQPYRGPRVRSRSTGETYYWVGDHYEPENSPRRLSAPEQQARQQALDVASNYEQHLPDLRRFEELNRTVPTGALSHRLGQALGLPRLFSFDNDPGPGNTARGLDEQRSITSRLTPDQREPGSGSSSNLDVTMFREGLPNIGNAGPTNSRIIEGYRRQAADARAYADFIEWYWPRTGSMTGADAQFAQYRAARQRNPNLTWQQHFRVEAPARPQGVPETAQWDWARRRWVEP
jgi:hypothetical protein